MGLVVGAGSATVGGDLPLVVDQPDGSRIATIPGGETWQVTVAGNQLVVSSPAGWVSPPLDAFTLAAVQPGAPVRVNGRGYRGVAEFLRDRTGLTVVNRVGMEGYLLGVVTAEMGRRSSVELAALRAQAVVSRTYALRNLGRWRAQGFDLYATVADQAYGGIGAESPEARVAVSDTRGRVLTYNGALIEAFFYSTCGGRTAGERKSFDARSARISVRCRMRRRMDRRTAASPRAFIGTRSGPVSRFVPRCSATCPERRGRDSERLRP